MACAGVSLAIGGIEAEGIGSEHDDVLRLAAPAPTSMYFRDEIERIGAAGVFRQRAVVEIRWRFSSRTTFSSTVPKRAASSRRFRLRFGGQNGLGIAAAFEVEDAMLAPAMLVVADQQAGRICRCAWSCRCRTGRRRRRCRRSGLHWPSSARASHPSQAGCS